MKKILATGGFLLGMSAIASKFLSLWRDRLLLDTFGEREVIDLIFASFRIPDFFFFLFIGGTVSTLFLPRLSPLKKEDEQHEFVSSFMWGVVVLFGALCGAGALFTKSLIAIFAGGFDLFLQEQMVPLARLLFGSVFLLALSSVFSAFQQSKERFWSIALAPVLYTGTICLVLFIFRDQWGLLTVGFGALGGAFFHFLCNVGAFFLKGGRLSWVWKKPIRAWKHFKSDFLYRVITSASFQINQSVDILIASFLIAGTVGAFSIGSNLGHVLLSIVGLPLANAAFPKLTKAKHFYEEQKKIVYQTIRWIVVLVIPFSLISAFLSEWLVQLLFSLEGSALWMTKTVFIWTVISLPFACVIPIFSRVFLANDDTKTPLRLSAVSLLIATGLAAWLSLFVFPRDLAILGLAIGNFVANTLSAFLFGIWLWARYFGNNEGRV